MKKILISLTLVFGLLSVVKADTTVLTLSGNQSNNVIVLGPIKLNSISVSSTSATNGTLRFYDSPYGTNTVGISAFTNVTKSVATTNILYTNVFGVISTNSYSVIRYTTNTLAAGLRTRELIASIDSVSNTVTTFEFTGRYLGFGLTVTNISQLGGTPGSVTINVDYDKLR